MSRYVTGNFGLLDFIEIDIIMKIQACIKFSGT